MQLIADINLRNLQCPNDVRPAYHSFFSNIRLPCTDLVSDNAVWRHLCKKALRLGEWRTGRMMKMMQQHCSWNRERKAPRPKSCAVSDKLDEDFVALCRLSWL
jgi:hypothetical protein